jgi:hypothetical protein
MNTLLLIAKGLLSAGLACLVAIMSSIMMTVILAKIVDILGLNYKGDTYWVLHISIFTLIIGWIISFVCFMSILR